MQDAAELLLLLDREGRVVYANPAAERLLGLGVAAAGRQLLDVVHADDGAQLQHDVAVVLREPGQSRRFDFRVSQPNGTWRQLECVARNLLDDPAVNALVLHSLDVTDRRRAEDRLEHARLHDPLTGLPGRVLFTEQLQQAIAHEARTPTRVVVFGVDLDHFNAVNELYGFATGDEVLRGIGRRLHKTLRPNDTVAGGSTMVTRVGGDEFYVLCESVPDVDSAAAIAARLDAAIREEPVIVEGVEVAITATVGVALSRGPDTDADSLLIDAGRAVEVGKQHGGARVEFFDAGVRHDANVRSARVIELRHAIEDNQLRLDYQPKIEISSGQLVGVEALARWAHPERGIVPPSAFIALAEDSGLIDALGEWVLIEACRQRAAWKPILQVPSRLLMCVNVSSRQFNPSFPKLLRRVLADADVPRGSLCIEITESAVMSDVDSAISTLQELRELGVEVSIDDFGTGFSSLAQLKRLPLDELKIDKSFIDGLGRDRDDTAIVAAVVAMAQALDLWVTAEGVETSDQLAQLRTLGCELAQGFLFSRPVHADQITDYLAGGRDLRLPMTDGLALGTTREPDLVLVVDDAAELRQLAHVSLAASGFEVVEALDGQGALAAARRLRPTCVVLDVSMPGISGFDVCRALRADPLTAGCTIVMLTANESAEDKVEAFSAGADDYMIKPFAPRDLVGRVRSAINRRRGPSGETG